MRQNVNELDIFPDEFHIKSNRVISIEMFERLKNYQILLGNVKLLMKCDAKLLVHMFADKDKSYDFESGWMWR